MCTLSRGWHDVKKEWKCLLRFKKDKEADFLLSLPEECSFAHTLISGSGPPELEGKKVLF